MLRLENVRSGYIKDQQILTGVSLNVTAGEVVAIVGQNGAGKSTLAKTIMGLLPHVAGSVILNNNDIVGLPVHKIVLLGVGYMMQGGQIFPHLTVSENLRFAIGGSRRDYMNRLEDIKQHFDFIGSGEGGRLNAPASHLSGGERHQLALAMVMMRKPGLLILDEPSAGLSPANTGRLYQLLAALRKQESITTLIIEQNIVKAVDFSERILLIRNGTIAREEQSSRLREVEEIGKFIFD